MNGFFIRQQFSNDRQADIRKIKMLQIFILLCIFKERWKLFQIFKRSSVVITNGILIHSQYQQPFFSIKVSTNVICIL